MRLIPVNYFCYDSKTLTKEPGSTFEAVDMQT